MLQVTGVAKDRRAFFFRIKHSENNFGLLGPREKDATILPKRRKSFTGTTHHNTPQHRCETLKIST
jgi:hypothetical protein